MERAFNWFWDLLPDWFIDLLPDWFLDLEWIVRALCIMLIVGFLINLLGKIYSRIKNSYTESEEYISNEDISEEEFSSQEEEMVGMSIENIVGFISRFFTFLAYWLGLHTVIFVVYTGVFDELDIKVGIAAPAILSLLSFYLTYQIMKREEKPKDPLKYVAILVAILVIGGFAVLFSLIN